MQGRAEVCQGLSEETQTLKARAGEKKGGRGRVFGHLPDTGGDIAANFTMSKNNERHATGATMLVGHERQRGDENLIAACRRRQVISPARRWTGESDLIDHSNLPQFLPPKKFVHLTGEAGINVPQGLFNGMERAVQVIGLAETRERTQ